MPNRLDAKLFEKKETTKSKRYFLLLLLFSLSDSSLKHKYQKKPERNNSQNVTAHPHFAMPHNMVIRIVVVAAAIPFAAIASSTINEPHYATHSHSHTTNKLILNANSI